MKVSWRVWLGMGLMSAGAVSACGKDSQGVESGAGAGGVDQAAEGGAEQTPGGARPEGGAGGDASLGGAAGRDESAGGDSPGGAPAIPQVCEPGRKLCQEGHVLTTCNAEGTGILPEQKDCGEDATCRDGECLPKICVGNSTCLNGEIAYCSADALRVTSTEACKAGTSCVDEGDAARCELQVCVPGLFACLGNRTGKCGPDGLSLSSVTNDCEGAVQVCVSHTACAESATDEMGASEDTTNLQGSLFGNRVTVRSSRQLTELSAKVALPYGGKIRFVVYEGSSPDSPSTLIADKLVTVEKTDGYVSSGKLAVTLVAGRTYVLGIVHAPYGYADDAPYDRDVSFGTVIGSFFTEYATTLTPNQANNDRLLTLRATTILN